MIQGPDRPLRLPCAVTIAGDELTVDWDGAPPEQQVGAMNCTYSYAAAHTVYVLKSILTPEIPSNAGCFRPLHVLAPQGSIFNCSYPAAVNQRTMAGWFCGPAVFRALAPVLPDRVQAFTGLPVACSGYGQDRSGGIFNDHIMFGGGQGGSQHHDGTSGLMYPTSAGNVPVEMFEQRTPLLVERKELIADSAGVGFHRGGLGQRMRVRKLYDDTLPVLVNVLPHGLATPMAGLRGGTAGSGAGFRVEGAAMSEGGAMSRLVELRAPEGVITVETAGGSGFGDPHTRPIELIQRDVEDGYVTVDGLAAYGAEGPEGATAPITRMPRSASR